MDKLEGDIEGHNGYIDDTTDVINKIQIELAVQESSMETLKEDIAEIKTDVKTLLTR
jgi:archaellum component FlaC